MSNERDDERRVNLRGSSVPGRHLDRDRKDDQDTEPMRFEQATDFHKLRDQLTREMQRIDRETKKLDLAIIGTDINPGVYAMTASMMAEVGRLREDIKED